MAVAAEKSRGRLCALSPAGSAGLMQLVSATIEAWHVADRFDPRQNLGAGARLVACDHGDIARSRAAPHEGGDSLRDEWYCHFRTGPKTRPLGPIRSVRAVRPGRSRPSIRAPSDPVAQRSRGIFEIGAREEGV